MAASNWDQSYLEGSDRWELGRHTPPLGVCCALTTGHASRRGGCWCPVFGRGHEAVLLADLGYEATGLDFSGEEIQRAQALHVNGNN